MESVRITEKEKLILKSEIQKILDFDLNACNCSSFWEFFIWIGKEISSLTEIAYEKGKQAGYQEGWQDGVRYRQEYEEEESDGK